MPSALAQSRIARQAGRCFLLAVTLVLLMAMPTAATDVWISHIASAAGWRTRLSVYAAGTVGAATMLLRRLDDRGLALGEPVELPLANQAWSEVPAEILAYDGSARLQSERDLLLRVSYRYDDTFSLCEFYLNGEQCTGWVLPNPSFSWFDWAGLALVNGNEARNSVTLEAWQQGQKVGEQAISLTGHSRYARLSDQVWNGLSMADFDTAVIRSDLPIPAPLAIIGNQPQDRHLFFAAQPLPASADYHCLVNGVLIDGTGREPVSDAAVLFRDDLIVAVGPRNQVTIPPRTELVDVNGAYILPGFINAHVHNAIQQSNLKIWARAGVTTVRDVGAAENSQAVFQFRETVRAVPECARLLAAGPLVTAPGGYPLVPNGFPALTVEDAADARQKIQRLLDQGADLIKITLEPGSGLPTLSEDETRAIVETAHAQHIPVTAHITRADYLQRGANAGIDCIEHIGVDRMSDNLIAQLARQRIWVVPTLTALGLNAQAISNCRRFLAAGGRVALGNDSGYMANLEIGMPVAELAALQQAGLTPMQVLQAATKNAAEVCRLEKIIGALEPGKKADILVVRGNPLEDWNHLRDVQAVYHGGVAIRPQPEKAPAAEASTNGIECSAATPAAGSTSSPIGKPAAGSEASVARLPARSRRGIGLSPWGGSIVDGLAKGRQGRQARNWFIDKYGLAGETPNAKRLRVFTARGLAVN